MLKTACTGAPINENDIPPELFIAPPPSSSQPTLVSQELPVKAPSLQTSALSLQADNKPNNSQSK